VNFTAMIFLPFSPMILAEQGAGGMGADPRRCRALEKIPMIGYADR
jgi:hypothetical protein